jgi:hypothetical protein
MVHSVHIIPRLGCYNKGVNKHGEVLDAGVFSKKRVHPLPITRA